MNVETASETKFITHCVPYLDAFLERFAKVLKKVSRVEGAGAFYHRGASPLFGLWREEYPRSTSYVLRAGRLELGIDLRRKR